MPQILPHLSVTAPLSPSLAKETHKKTMHSSSMRSDRGLPGSSLIEYIQASYKAEPFSTKIEFNLIGENHHMRYYLPPDRGHKYIKLFYPDREHVRSILKTVKVPSVLYLRGCDQLQCEIFSPFQNTAGFEIPFPNMTGIEYPFQNFKTLTVLELSGMDNLVTLPDEISEMNQLQSLNLSDLPIQHFPSDDFFSKLTNLCSLVLKACPNLHSLPKFSNLTALVSLDLSYLLIKAFPDGIFTNLKKLHKLILRGCSNLHSLPSIEPLKSLTFLDISNNTLECTTTPLAFNPTLTHVFARYAKGSVCDYLVHHEQISVLDLSGAQDLGENFQLREYPPRLKALDISRTSIKSIDVQPPTFCNSHLEILLIRNCSSLVELSAMKRLKSLRVLSLTGCNNLCVLPEDLCELVMLRELNLSGCTSLTELRDGVFDKMNQLEKLDLSKTNFKHLPSFVKLISLRTRLILPRGLALQVPELSSDIESKNLVIVEDDVASFDLESEDQEGSIPNEFHLVSTFTNTDSSFYRFKHEFRRVKDSILDIQSKIEANSPDTTNIVSKKQPRTMLADLEYILENIDLLESADLKGNAMNLLDRLMDVVGHGNAHDFDRLKDLLRLVCKLKLLIPCPKREDFDSKKMKDIGQDSDNNVSRLYENLQSDDFRYYILLKSYNSLTRAQRSCLLYLSIFPMNSDSIEIKQRTLIQLWYGEGFIDDARHEQNVAPSSRASSSSNTSHMLISSADTVEEIGRKFLLILQVKGFIDKRSNNSRTFVMDEMVHCFLRKKAKEDHFIGLEDQNWKLTPQLTSGSEIALLLNSQYSFPSSCQLWLSYANTRRKLECFKKIRVLFNVNERTIDLRAEWFSKMRNLYVLDIGTWESEYKYIEIVDLNFLEELKNMKQLRVLSFEGVAGITKLPDSACQLTHLIILNLRECSQMEELPDGIGSLHNLSHLDVTNCPLLSMLPKGIRLLSKLEVLKGFLITYDVDGRQNKKACALADLVKLEKLRKLNLVVNLPKFPSTEDLQVFKGVKNLCNLKITWFQNHYTDQKIQDSIGRKASRRSRWKNLKCWEGLTPNNEETEDPLRRSCLEKLTKLVLCCFPSETAPDWLHPTELHNLEKLYIIGGHLKTLLPAYSNQNTSWNVKALHLDHTLKVDIEWESLVQIFPNLKLLIKLPQDHLLNFPVDDDGLWKGF